MKRYLTTLICAVASLTNASYVHAQSFSDARVQNPQLSAPQRGSLAGQLSSTAFGPADVSRGDYTLPSPVAIPSERGSLLADVFPKYSPENGISEWGMGWKSTTSLTRWRVAGDIDFAKDELNGPWGRMPALTEVSTRYKAASGAVGKMAFLETAAGKAITTASLIPEGWKFERIAQELRASRETNALNKPVFSGALANLTVAALLTGQQVANTKASTFGFSVSSCIRTSNARSR
jgi:hypothetical protein